MQEGMLCKETHDHVIRLAPPLVITREEIDWAVEKLKKVLVVALTSVRSVRVTRIAPESPNPESRILEVI